VWRRSLYIFVKRANLFPFLQTFDGPTAIGSCARRTPTTTAPQALMLMNDAFTREQARRFAGRVAWDAGPDSRARVTRAFQLAYARPPTVVELATAVRFLAAQAETHRRALADQTSDPRATELAAFTDFAQTLLASGEFSFVD
jgi:hypothetical protein